MVYSLAKIKFAGVPLFTMSRKMETRHLLLGSGETNQSCFEKFLFHLIEVAVSIDFAHEKILFLTGFAHRKSLLWKGCELDFQILFDNVPATPNQVRPNKQILAKPLSSIILSVSRWSNYRQSITSIIIRFRLKRWLFKFFNLRQVFERI